MDKETRDHIINYMRQGTITWSGRGECLNRASVTKVEGYVKTGPNKGSPKYKKFWRCAKCEKLYRDIKEMEVDHIKEIGNTDGLTLDEIAAKMYCGQENLQCLCIACHLRKTNFGNSIARFERKKPR